MGSSFVMLDLRSSGQDWRSGYVRHRPGIASSGSSLLVRCAESLASPVMKLRQGNWLREVEPGTGHGGWRWLFKSAASVLNLEVAVEVEIRPETLAASVGR